jgi:hypothetical protein
MEYLKKKNEYTLNDLLNCEFYDIHIYKDTKFKYLNSLLEDSSVFYNLIYKKIKLNLTLDDSNELTTFIKSRINKFNPSTNDIKLMLILKHVKFDFFEINKEKVDLYELYKFIINEERTTTSFNRAVFNTIVPTIADLIETNYDFITFLQNSDNHLILLNSNLPLHIKFGVTQNEIAHTVLNYCKPSYGLKYPKDTTDEFLNKYEVPLSKIFLKNCSYDYTIFKDIKQIFNIEQEFFDRTNLPTKFKQILLDLSNYDSSIHWIKSFMDIVRFDKSFFDKEFSSKLLNFPYVLQKIVIENQYLNTTYLDELYYTQFLRILVTNMTEQTDIEDVGVAALDHQ